MASKATLALKAPVNLRLVFFIGLVNLVVFIYLNLWSQFRGVLQAAEAELKNGSINVTSTGVVIIDGFKIQQTNDISDVILLSGSSKSTVTNCIIRRDGINAGIGIRAITTSAGSGAKTIQNNLFTGDISGGVFSGHKTWNNAVYVNGASSTVSILNNTFQYCRTALSLDDFNNGITISGNTLDWCGTFLAFGGTTPTNGQYVLGANDFKNPQDAIVNLSNVNVAFRLNMTSSTFNGLPISSYSLANLFLIEAGMYHRGRSGRNGLVYYVSGTEYVYGPLTTIQSAVNYGASGDVINVRAGSYNERVTVSKSLKIQGEDKVTTILTGTGLSGAGSGFFVNNGITNVTIKNFTIQNFAGTSPNSYAGVYATGGNDNLTVSNCIIKDNVGGCGIYANGPINNVLIDGNTVSGHSNAFGAARGIVIWNGLKQNITVTNNEVFNNNCCGIELQDGTASGVTMTNNNVHDNGDNGLGLIGLQGPGVNLINMNTVKNNGRFGIEIKNPNGSGLSSGPGSVVVDANVVSRTNPIGAELRDIAGISVYRRGVLAGNVDVPYGTYISNNTVTGFVQPSTSDGFGIVMEGLNHTVTSNTVTGNDVGIQRQAGYTPYPGDGDQTNKADTYFGRGNSPITCGVVVVGNTLSNTIDTRDVGNSSGLGIVTNTNTGKSYCSIQAAINDPATANGHTIQASAGTYAENITVSKSLILIGPNANTDCSGTRFAEAKIVGAGGTGNVALKITGNDVTINGFEITNPLGSYGISEQGRSNINIKYNYIHDIGNNSTGSGVSNGVQIESNAIASNVNITYNCVSDIRGGQNSPTSSTNGSANGIGVNSSTSNFNLTGLDISSNSISNISACSTNGTGGKGAYGVIINIGASGSGKSINATMTNNAISNLNGRWSHGIGLEGNTLNALIANNLFTSFSSAAGDNVGVLVEDNASVSTVQIHENSFLNNGFGIVNIMAGNLNGSCNWYNSTNNNSIAAMVGGNVTYTPYLINGVDNSPSIGFQPVPGSCIGIPVSNVQLTSSSNVTCFGGNDGSATFSFDNGFTSYSYSLNGGPDISIPGSPFTINNLSANPSYTVVVKDGGGNTSSKVFSITQPLETIVNAGPDIKVCGENGSVNLNGIVSGGTTTAHWEGGLGTFNPDRNTLNAEYTPLPVETGTQVTLTLVSDGLPMGECHPFDDIVITVDPPLIVNAGVDQNICGGATVQLSGNGPLVTHYSWQGGAGSFSPSIEDPNAIYTLDPGEIGNTITLTLLADGLPDNVCPASDDLMVTVNVNPTVSIAVSNADFCSNLTLTANPSPAGSYTYQWKLNGVDFATVKSINLTNANADGNYTVSATNTATGCVSLYSSPYNFVGQTSLSNYTILGLNEVKLGQSNIVNGAVGNTGVGKKVAIDKNSTVNGFIKASVIALTQPVVVTGGTFSGNPAVVTLPTMQFNVATPSGPNYSVPDNATGITIGSPYKDITIGKNAVVTITGSVYGNITIKEGAQVTFTQSVIDINNITTSAGKANVNYTTMNFNGSTVRIKNKVTIGDRNRVNGVNTTFYMGDISPDAEKFTVNGNDTKVTANIYMPHGKLNVPGTSGNCIMTGKFISENIESNNSVTWNGYSCDAPPAPFNENNDNSNQQHLELFYVNVFPNPTEDEFNIQINTSSDEPVFIKLVDITGKILSLKTYNNLKSSVQFGHGFAIGTYFAEVIQGSNHQVVKLVKTN